MDTKKLIALLMTLVMAIGLSLVFTACSEDEAQVTDQQATAAEDEEGGDGESVTPASEEESEDVAGAADEYVDLAGEYQDEVGQRAAATVIANTESKSVSITIYWGTSATESSEWTMNAVKEGNKLVYSDCVKTNYLISEDMDEEGEGDEDGTGGGAEETVEYEGGAGSFEITEDGKLLWNGASEADCQSCVFVKTTE